jgi:CRISPR system Cascade subunit CasE
MSGELRMIRMRFDGRRLYELGRRRRLPATADVGYLLHCALKELFGDGAPGPFAVRERSARGVAVLAYSVRPAAELIDHASTYAQPDVFGVCDVRGIEEKVMPAEWPVGKLVGFETRVCPVVRMSRAGPHWKAGAEVDAFLAECRRTEGRVERQAVYREWLADEIARRGGAALATSRVIAHQRERLVRRDHGEQRKSHLAERPDVVMGGELVVEDGAKFTALLARGLGRHRGFGFGMLLLSPPARAC